MNWCIKSNTLQASCFSVHSLYPLHLPQLWWVCFYTCLIFTSSSLLYILLSWVRNLKGLAGRLHFVQWKEHWLLVFGVLPYTSQLHLQNSLIFCWWWFCFCQKDLCRANWVVQTSSSCPSWCTVLQCQLWLSPMQSYLIKPGQSYPKAEPCKQRRCGHQALSRALFSSLSPSAEPHFLALG